MLRFLNAIMYPHKADFMEVVSDYIDFSQNDQLRQKVKLMLGIGQIILEDGIERGIECGIEAFILDNEEEGIPRYRIIEKLQRRFNLSEEGAKDYYKKFMKVNP